MRCKLPLLLLIFCCTCGFAHAELVFSAPPRESESAGQELYGPLAEHLSELLGERVTYEYPKNWLQYQRDLRKGVYDIVFDGPHFVSWRMLHLKHEVLVKLPGTLQFVIIVNAGDKEIQQQKDLIGKKICALPPPNLATLTAISLFPNPVRQPVIWGVKGSYDKVFNEFSTGQCRAGVFRKTFYDKKLSAAERAKTRVIYTSKPLPNQAISVGSRVSQEKRSKIIRSLTLGKGRNASSSIAKRFGGKNSKSFVSANNKEYSNVSELLEGVVFGW